MSLKSTYEEKKKQREQNISLIEQQSQTIEELLEQNKKLSREKEEQSQTIEEQSQTIEELLEQNKELTQTVEQLKTEKSVQFSTIQTLKAEVSSLNSALKATEPIHPDSAQPQREKKRISVDDDLIKKTLPIILKFAFLAILLLSVIFTFTYCQNSLRSENRALQTKIQNIQTSTFKVTESRIQLYDLEKNEIDGFGTTSITLAEYFVVLEKGETWSLVRFDGDDYYIRTADLSHATAETVNLD